MKTTIQILNDMVLFENYANVHKVLEDFFLVTRRRCDSEEVIDGVIQ